jgi:hypothetical protein
MGVRMLVRLALSFLIALILLLGNVHADDAPEYRLYLPIAHTAPYYVVCKAGQDVCDEPPAISTATPNVPTLIPPFSITRTPRP